MINRRSGACGILVCSLALSGEAALQAQDATEAKYAIEHPECALFGPERHKFLAAVKENYAAGELTRHVAERLAVPSAISLPDSASTPRAVPSGTRTSAVQRGRSSSFIDRYLFEAMRDAGVTPAAQTNDFEFMRRVTLDLTGRIPTPERVVSFAADTAPDKRARLVDELLASPEWADKWTMFFGDLYKNTAFKRSAGTNLYNEGRNAFYKWIHSSIESGKPYSQMASEIIASDGGNTWDPAQGPLNWTVLGRVTGGPVQDTQDQLTANVAETFLGIANLNCVLCHNGRGHLDQLNLWGKDTTRYDAWHMAAFMAHTPNAQVIRPDPTKPNYYYWAMHEMKPGERGYADYQLGSTSGNRPARTPVGSEKTIAPVYIFSGRGPQPGENYRAAFAREVTGDFQFARASVNYIWKQFFARGIVEPANQFDLARLDPDNPPPDPWTLQPSNPRLLNALAQSFVDSGYDLKTLMRQITTSEAYQLSSRYDGTWTPAMEKLFARKLVRRLWGEEIHDAIAQSSGVLPSYNVYLGRDPNDVPGGTVKVNWAMKFPEPNGNPAGGFLNAFLPGNRDDEERRGETSLTQALNLMNDPFVMNRVRAAPSGPNSLINRNLAGTDEQLVDNFYLAVLSRYPNDVEKSTALASLKNGDRKQRAEDLLWSLYNKVDFIFNY